MPAYDATSKTKPVNSVGFGQVVWNNELVAVGGKSMKISLNRDPNLPSAFSVEARFSAAPGTFAIDVQTADTDADEYYVNKTGASLSAVNASFVGRLEVTNVVAKFARLIMTAKANAVNVTAQVN